MVSPRSSARLNGLESKEYVLAGRPLFFRACGAILIFCKEKASAFNSWQMKVRSCDGHSRLHLVLVEALWEQ